MATAGEYEVVRECLEWPKMREMEMQLQALSRQVERGLSDECVRSIEHLILAKVDQALGDLVARVEHVEAKVDRSLAPIVQSVALSHMEVREQLDGIRDGLERKELADQRVLTNLELVERKVDGSLAPMVQTLALAHLDLEASQHDFPEIRNRLTSLETRSCDRLSRSPVAPEVGRVLSETKSIQACEQVTVKMSGVQTATRAVSTGVQATELHASTSGRSFESHGVQASASTQTKGVQACCDDLYETALPRQVVQASMSTQSKGVQACFDGQTERKARTNVDASRTPACLLDLAPELDVQKWQSLRSQFSAEEDHLDSKRAGPLPTTIAFTLEDTSSIFMKQVRPRKGELTPGRVRKARGGKAEDSLDFATALNEDAPSTIGTRTLLRRGGSRSLPYLPPVF